MSSNEHSDVQQTEEIEITEDPEVTGGEKPNVEPMIDIEEMIKECSDTLSESIDAKENVCSFVYVGSSNLLVLDGWELSDYALKKLTNNPRVQYLYTMHQALVIKRNEERKDMWKVVYNAFCLPGEKILAVTKDGEERLITNPLGILTNTELWGFCIATCIYVPPESVNRVVEQINDERRERMCAKCEDSNMWMVLPITMMQDGVELHFCSTACRDKMSETNLEEASLSERVGDIVIDGDTKDVEQE